MAHAVVHWEIGGSDAAATREFYAKAFGWPMIDAGPGYTLVPAAEEGIGGGIIQVEADVPPYVTIYVKVDDLAAKLTELGALGAKTIVTPMVINETTSFAMFADPDGRVVGLLEERAPTSK